MVRVSVIVTTYNWPEALRAVLQGLKAQDRQDFEVVVADDGSTNETRSLIKEFTPIFPVPLQHIWQEDKGFRAAAARNRALAASRGQYIIFLDGDCIPFPDFVSTHLLLAEEGWFVTGNRVLASQSFSRRVLQQQLPVHAWGLRTWSWARLTGAINRILPFIRVQSNAFRKLNTHQWKGAKTCNLGVWKAALLDVNGFNEQYVGWGHEDADLVVRLIRNKVFRKDARFVIPVLHLWHPENNRSLLRENEQRLEAILHGESTWAETGLQQYLS